MEDKALVREVLDREINVGSTERMASAIAGGALTLYGLRRKDLPGALIAAAGGMLMYRGGTGYCPAYGAAGVNTAGSETQAVRATEVTTIGVPAEQLYSFWRNFENLPRIMHNLESVQVRETGTSVWKAKGPLGSTVEWEAVVIEDVPNKRIAWQSTEHATIQNSGVVTFESATGGRGTVVRVDVSYHPPAGKAGQMVASLMGSAPEQEIREDLRRFKQLMETGEIPTTKGQPAARS
jgi:uncharacterized membrane protein